MSDGQYEALAAPFGHTFRDTRGGATFDYLTGEQVTTRLNEVLGPYGWSFRVLEHGIHVEADECWAHGELSATFVIADLSGDGFREKTVTRQQFGSQKVKRSRSSGTPLDIGFDLKGAATDALKKCATLIGVGLYLSEKGAPAQARPQQQNADPPFKYANVQERFKAAAEYERLVKVAVETSYPHAERAQGKRAKDLSDDELEGSIRVLRKWELSQRPEGAAS